MPQDLRSAQASKWESLPTEAINPNSLGLDTAPIGEIIDLMIAEDRKVVAAVHRERDRIAHGVEIIAQALRRGGRIFFIGAGTSGRLGVVEAAEMPPTFGTSPAAVQAIMAGGKDAVFKAKEGVEDDYEEGARAVARLRPNKKDVVIGVSASGLTPFVRGGLTRARKSGLRIIFVTCWPGADLQNFVDLVIAPGVGPEVLTGSTRLKAAHRHQDGAEHAHHHRDGPHRQGLRQPDGRRPGQLREAEGPRPPHRRHRHRHRLRLGRRTAPPGPLERQDRGRHAPHRLVLHGAPSPS